MTTEAPLQSASRAQQRASDPTASVFVTANAGSGKTHVLVNRIVRLLLAGTAPERILCLTYTRAAAAEMASRLFDRLAGWIGLDDAALEAAIADITGTAGTDAAGLADARRLFARAIETPGGLKIQTIHAFCERLLHRFPVEAGVVPGFSVLDERDAAELLAHCRTRVVSPPDDDPAMTEIVNAVARHAGPDDLDKLLTAILARRRDIAHVLESDATVEAAVAKLSAFFSIADDDTAQAIRAGYCAGLDRAGLAAGAALLAASDKVTDQDRAGLIGEALAAPSDERCWELMRDLLLTKAGEPRKEASLLTKAIREADPGLLDLLLSEQGRFRKAADKVKAVEMRDATAALLKLAHRIVAAFEDEKVRLGRYDYDDLINKTLDLVENAPSADWVLYRLDSGLDHVLIDEAQDTSPEQWRIIERLTGDFFSGAGARGDVTRTVFAVGDAKQSIFSFQGADPGSLERMHRVFREKVTRAGQNFDTVPFQVSFRTTEDVLKLVDWVFRQPDARPGVAAGDDDLVHEAVRRGQPGLIEVWPFEGKSEKPQRSPWQAPRADADSEAPERRLADRIAAEIRGWLDCGERLDSRDRPITPGDILILVRTRSRLHEALLRALKQRGIAVAGADRLRLTRSLAVQDLMTLARFCLLPRDDLVTAGLLKSSLIARDDGRPFVDDDLFELAHGRGTTSLLSRLRRAAADGAPYSKAVSVLDEWLGLAGFVPPYEFFSRVLNSGRRRAMVARLGSEAHETIDAFLLQALDHETVATPSLVSFLDWLEAADTEIKRDMEHGSDEVRIMTVHGAKGLEAPVVILPDTVSIPDSKRRSNFFARVGDDAATPPLWRLKKAFDIPLTEALCERETEQAFEEYNRLLYVAMTRARDRLYIAGCGNADEADPRSWYALIAAGLHNLVNEALGDMSYEKVLDGREVTCWRIKGTGKERDRPGRNDRAARPEPAPLPAWATTPPPPEPAPPPWLKPSDLGASSETASAGHGEQISSPLSDADRHRFERGRLIHALLQYLPDAPLADRRELARRWLDRAAAAMPEADRDALVGEVMAVIEDRRFAPLFGAGSLAEVDVSALIEDEDGRPAGLNGRIDRLAVGDDGVLIVDYKTNRPPPATPQQVDSLYLHQLAAYRRALAAIYPGRPVRAALLWTDIPQLMEIPAELLDGLL